MTEETTVYVEKGPPALIVMGWVMILAGVVVAGLGFSYSVAVDTAGGGVYGLPDRIANIDKVAIRHMILACGLTAFVSGWISLAGGMILEEIRKRT